MGSENADGIDDRVAGAAARVSAFSGDTQTAGIPNAGSRVACRRFAARLSPGWIAISHAWRQFVPRKSRHLLARITYSRALSDRLSVTRTGGRI